MNPVDLPAAMQTPTERAVIAFVTAHLQHATARSAPYRRGFTSQLLWWTHGAPRGMGASVPPHPLGTAEADAWWAGWDAAGNQTIRSLCVRAVNRALDGAAA